MKKIRVLQITGGLNTGGLETVAMNTVRFSDRSKISFDFLVYTDAIGAYEKEAENLGCHVIHMHKPNNYFTFYQELKKTFKENGPYDVVYSHTFFNSGIAMRAAKACGVKKCIAHAHNTERFKDRALLRSLFYKVMRCWLNKYADYRLACSAAAGAYVYGDGAEFKVIRNGINVDNFVFNQEAREKTRTELSLGDSFVIGNISRISEAKNYLFLVRTFFELLKNKSNSKLLIVGDGDLRPQVEAEIVKLGLEDKTILTGSRSDVPELLSALDCFVFPSIHEGLGISAVEAQASGLSVLCSDSVPHEVQVTDLLTFKSLKDGEKSWAESIIKLSDIGDKENRKNRVREIREAGYDIKSSVQEIEAILIL